MEKSEKAEDTGKTEAVPSVDVAVDRNEHAKEMIEKEYGQKLLTTVEVQQMGYESLVCWMKSISKYGNLKRTVLYLGSEDRICVKFFTADNCYSISARFSEVNDGYLGCIAQCRKSRVGETWARGSDLKDGDYSKKTFDGIVRDIVSYEMKFLQCFN